MTISVSIQNPSRNLALESWRGIACLMVFWHHTGTYLVIPPLVISGGTGVHMFFVLSGYLIFRPFMYALLKDGHLPSLGNFYLRRFLRIIPCYLVALTFYVLMRHLTHEKVPDIFNLLTHVFLVFNYFPSLNIFSINGVFWTLAIEAQFYILIPLVVLLINKIFHLKKTKAVITIISLFLIVGIIARIIEFNLSEVQPRTESFVRIRTVFSFLDMFGFGMLTAYLETIPTLFKQKPRLLQRCLLITGILLFIISNNWHYTVNKGVWLSSEDFVFTVMFPVLICFGLAILLLLFTSSPLKKNRIMTQKPLVFIGEISYSLYLYHIGVQFCLFKFISLNGIIENFYLRGFFYGLLFLPPSLLVAYIMYLLVEKPSLGWVELVRRTNEIKNN